MAHLQKARKSDFTYKLQSRKNEHGEYLIKCYRRGCRYEDGDYFTDSKQDAIETLHACQQKEGFNIPYTEIIIE